MEARIISTTFLGAT